MIESEKVQPADKETFDSNASEALHAQEATLLRDRITDLLAEVEALRAVSKSQDGLEGLIVQLREANQYLVIATVGAQGMQADAEAANQRQE